jgi:curved DNA-binding protein
VKVPTLGGKVDLNIGAGARSGQKLRLKGRGLPVAGEPPGDQFAVLQIMAPPADDADRKALYEKMAREMPFNPRAQMGG